LRGAKGRQSRRKMSRSKREERASRRMGKELGSGAAGHSCGYVHEGWPNTLASNELISAPLTRSACMAGSTQGSVGVAAEVVVVFEA